MPLTNPSAILHQNLKTVMKNKPEEKPLNRNTLMGPPKKQMQKENKDDVLTPSRRVATYIEMLQKKREEILKD
jgi:hypothetical protein